MSREIHLVFPNNTACIAIDFLPFVGDVIDHDKFGCGKVERVVHFLSSYKTGIKTVTKIILSEYTK